MRLAFIAIILPRSPTAASFHSLVVSHAKQVVSLFSKILEVPKDSYLFLNKRSVSSPQASKHPLTVSGYVLAVRPPAGGTGRGSGADGGENLSLVLRIVAHCISASTQAAGC